MLCLILSDYALFCKVWDFPFHFLLYLPVITFLLNSVHVTSTPSAAPGTPLPWYPQSPFSSSALPAVCRCSL